MHKYIRNKNTISSRLNDEIVAMDLEKGKYFSLNPVATQIWELLEQPRGFEELCNMLMEEYDVEAEQCRTETKECLIKLTDIGLVSEID